MSDTATTRRLCANGHLMDAAWEVCPFCPATRRPDAALARTVRIETPAPAPTSVEPVAGPQPAPPAAAVPRRTQLLERPAAIDAIAWLIGIAGASRGCVHRIASERATIGADAACEVFVDHDHVSERHASLRFRGDHFVVTDLDSTNGTWVNEERVGQAALADGDRVRFGDAAWIFKCVVFEPA